MRIDALKPGMVLRRKYPYYYGLDDQPEDSVVLLRVPDELTFAQKKEGGYGYSSSRTVRVPQLEVYYVTFIDHEGTSVSTKVVRAQKEFLAVPGRELRYVADRISDAMAKLGREREEQRKREMERDELSERCYRVYEAAERLVPGYSSGVKRDAWMRRVELPIEVLEEIISKAQLYDDYRED